MSHFSRSSSELNTTSLMLQMFYVLLRFLPLVLIFWIVLLTIPISKTAAKASHPKSANFNLLVHEHSSEIASLFSEDKHFKSFIQRYLDSSQDVKESSVLEFSAIAEPNSSQGVGESDVLEFSAIAEPNSSQDVGESNVVALNSSTAHIPSCLYLHFSKISDTRFYWVPEVLEEKVNKNDIPVDLRNAIDPQFSCELSQYEYDIISLVVFRESGNQTFLGQLLVAEDVISWIRSNNSWNNIEKTLITVYEAEKDDNGQLHIYLGDKEILEASESVQDAVELALSGSRVSSLLLQAVTEVRNEQYDLHLDAAYYEHGAKFHFNPELISEREAQKRTLKRIPVSFEFGDHIFYGHWLSQTNQLDL